MMKTKATLHLLKTVALLLIATVTLTACVNYEKIQAELRHKKAIEGAAFVAYCQSSSLSEEEQRSLQLLRRKKPEMSCLDLYSDIAFTDSLHAERLGLKDIRFVQYLPNITVITLDNNEIEDLSPLANVKTLAGIYMRNNRVSDVSPLANLPKLDRVNFYNNRISSIDNLMQLGANVNIFVGGNPIDKSRCRTDTPNFTINQFCYDLPAFLERHRNQPVLAKPAASDVSRILDLVLSNRAVTMYLHPEVPGRVPLQLALTPDLISSGLKMNAFGEPVEFVGARDINPQTLQVNLDCREAGCIVRLRYPIEGVSGQMIFEQNDKNWRLMSSSISE